MELGWGGSRAVSATWIFPTLAPLPVTTITKPVGVHPVVSHIDELQQVNCGTREPLFAVDKDITGKNFQKP